MRTLSFIFYTFILSLAAFLSLLAPPVQAQIQTNSVRTFIIDTDAGPDDSIAILYLLNQTQIKIKAISIEADGNADCKPAFVTLKGLLQLVHQSEIPLACGRPTPLEGNHHYPKAIIAAANHLEEGSLKKPQFKAPSFSAKELIIKTIKTSSTPIDILAIGPLTTLAEVFKEEPQLKSRIHMIYIMGGAIYVPGNIKDLVPKSSNTGAEWNIYIDPYAAEQLFHADLPLTLVPLDVTNQALIDQRFYKKLKNNHHKPAANFVYHLLKHNQQMIIDKAWYFWDPMAAVIAIDESLAKMTPLPLSVRLKPESFSGTTVIDDNKGAKLRVCLGIAVEKFKDELSRGLTS